jgi:hypothetical protein
MASLRRLHHHFPESCLFAPRDLLRLMKALPMQRTGRSPGDNQISVIRQRPQGRQVEAIPVQVRNQNRVNAPETRIGGSYITQKRAHSVA